MDYFKKNSNQTHRSTATGKRSKQDRRWTLLFIGNHGRTITLKRFKGIVILAVLVLFVTIGVSVGLFAWNLKIIMDNHGLRDDLKNMSDRIDRLRYDKDILMTRLVVAETKVQENSSGKIKETVPDKLSRQEQSIAVKKVENTQPAVKKTEPSAPKQAESQPSIVPTESGLSVAVENFEISNQASDNQLKIRFKVKYESEFPQSFRSRNGGPEGRSGQLAADPMGAAGGRKTDRKTTRSFFRYQLFQNHEIVDACA